MDWIAGLSGKAWAIIGASVLALGLVAAIVLNINDMVEDSRETGETVGRTEEVNKQLEKTIEVTEKSNEVREELETQIERGPTDTRLYDLCLRYNRGPAADCDKYLVPVVPSD